VRLFFAAWPPPATAAALHAWAEALGDGKLVPRENIHLTLAFLGEADPVRAAAAAKRVRGARHDLPIDEARSWRQNEIVWVGPRKMPRELEALVKALQLELYRDEFILERRLFAAHVTLLRKASGPRDMPGLPRVDWPVREFVLVRSRMSTRGAAYEPMEHFPLSE
jgi:2'-5' RNA ligase